MASFSDNILRLFKKMAKQHDQQANADQETALDGSEEARLKQLSDRAAQAEDVSILDSEFVSDDAMPSRGKEFLQGNLGASGAPREPHRRTTLERLNIIYDKQESDPVKESLRVVSFNKVISHRGQDELHGSGSNQIIDSEFDEPNNAGDFAGKLLGDQNKQIKAESWAASPSDALAPGKMVNPTEESFKQVATCATTSPTTLAWLASQPSAEIRAAVASNHHVPQDTLRKLATDADISVRLAVASNKRCADDILKQLTHDDNRLVSGEAFSALALREKANAQASGPAFNRFTPPKVNPVQTKVPVIGNTPPVKPLAPAPLSGKPSLPAPNFSKSASLPSSAPAAASVAAGPAPSPAAPPPPAPTPVRDIAVAAEIAAPPVVYDPAPCPAPAPSLSPITAPNPTPAQAVTQNPTPAQAVTPNLTPAPAVAPNPTAAPVSSVHSLLPPKAVTPRSLPKSTITAMPPASVPSPAANSASKSSTDSGARSPIQPKAPAPMLPPVVSKPATPVEHLVAAETPTNIKSTAQSQSQAQIQPAKVVEPVGESKVEGNPPLDLTPSAGPDGHNLLTNHKFKTTSNHLVASYTDLDAISVEMDNRSPNTWLSLNSEGAIKAYKKQKDTVKDVKMNLSAQNPNGPKRTSPIVNITPNATESETIAFLKLVAGRISTPPGRLKELAEHSNEEVRAAVAENVNLPSEAFLHLAKDAVSTVKLRLIDNSNCPTEVLGTLQNDSDPYVAFEARNALKRVGAGLAKEREQNQFRGHGHNNSSSGGSL